MTRKTRSPEQIVRELQRADEMASTGMSNVEIAAELGVSEATLYNWRKKYKGMDTQAAKELKTLKDENAKLKRIVAEQVLRIDAYKEIAEGKF